MIGAALQHCNVRLTLLLGGRSYDHCEFIHEVSTMNISKYALIALLALGSTSAMAEGGAERSRLFVQQFKESQEQLWGDKGSKAQKAEQVAQSDQRKPQGGSK